MMYLYRPAVVYLFSLSAIGIHKCRDAGRISIIVSDIIIYEYYTELYTLQDSRAANQIESFQHDVTRMDLAVT